METGKTGDQELVDLLTAYQYKPIRVMQRCYPRLIRGLKALGLDTDDMNQICLLAMTRCVRRYDPRKGKFPTYAFTSAQKELIHEFRRANVKLRSRLEPMPPDFDPPRAPEEPEGPDYPPLEPLLKRLKNPRDAELLRQYYLCSKTQRAIAKEFNMKLSTVNMALTRATTYLRGIFQ